MATSNKNFKVKNGLDVNGEINSLQSTGNEGGQINLAKPETTSLSGDVAIDVYNNKLRIFDKSGTNKGVYIDLTAAADGVGSNLLAGGGGGITSVVEDTTPQLGGDLDTNGNDITGLNALTLDTTPTGVPSVVGAVSWDTDFETIAVQLNNNVTLQVGQEHVVRVKNASGTTAIPNMTAVMFAGSTGDTVTVAPAVSDGTYPSDYFVGITTQEIPADGFGFVTQFGFVNGVNTSGWSVGTILALDPNNPGQLIDANAYPPSAPAWKMRIAAVTRSHAQTGRILVRAIPTNGLNTIHDVQISPPAPSEILAYDGNTDTWSNQTAADLGLSVVGHTHAISNITDLSTTLAGKSDVGHIHDDRYYTETEVGVLLSGKSDTSHTHDDRYYTETETNTLLADKANIAGPSFTGTTNAVDLVVSGNLTVQGTTTTISTSNLAVTDPLIYIGENNQSSSVDLGFVASFNDGTYQHTGLVRDSSDSKWKLFKGVTDEPTTTVNFAQGALDALGVGALDVTSLVSSGAISASGNLAINTNKFTVNATTGNTAVAGTLTVGDHMTVASAKQSAIATPATSSSTSNLWGDNRVVLTSSVANAKPPTLRPDGSALQAGDIWISF